MVLIKPELRQRVLRHIFLFRAWIYKELAARAGRRAGSVWNLLSRKGRKRPIKEEDFHETLADLEARPAHAALTAVWLEGMEALDRKDDGLTPEERDEREMRGLQLWRVYRATHTKLALLSREVPPLDRYPEPGDRQPIRWLARAQLEILKEHKDPAERLAIVQHGPEYQHWGLAEAAAEESTEAASRSVEEAAGWARVAAEAAERMKGPDWWQRRVRSYAGAFGPNALRVAGEHDKAALGLAQAEVLWRAGADPDEVLDPGRLLELEGSLLRGQRRCPEALDKLDEALQVSHHRARVLIKKAFTQEVMGEYEKAVETLREAESLVDPEREPRLHYMQRYNLAACCTHAGRHAEADALLREVRELVTEREDDNERARVDGLQGRVEAGLGRPAKARTLFERALARFADEGMDYDLALVLLELCALLLGQGETAEVRALTPRLTQVFASKEVHREALAALQLFQETAEREEADEELARRVLRFLYRARHDQGLRFGS